MRWRSVQNRS